MHNAHALTFQEALEVIESLPETQQDDLVELVRRRRAEDRREALSVSVEGARRELARGEVSRGTIDDLLAELAE